MARNFQLEIEEAGERLYVFPVASDPNYVHNKLLLIKSDYKIEPDELTYYHRKFIWLRCFCLKIWQLINDILKHLRWCIRSRSRPEYRYCLYLWGTYNIVPGEDLFYQRFSIHGQLHVKEHEWVDNYYLVPSQKYMALRVQEWLEDESSEPEEYKQSRQEHAAELKAWLQDKQSQGLDVHYYFSLDT